MQSPRGGVGSGAMALASVAGQRIAKSAPLLSDLIHFQTDLRIVRRVISPHRLRINPDQDAGPPLVVCMQTTTGQRDVERSNDPSSPAAPHPAVASGLLRLSQQILQHNIIQHHIRHQALELAVLVLKLLQAFGIGQVHPAVFGLQLVECRRTQSMLPAQVSCRQTVRRYKRSTIVCFTLEPCSLIIPIICPSVKRLFLIRLLLKGCADSTSD
jgi:hypothetical protein